ncbi:hypothetical protein EVAR_85792_1 [Eumeta japonica]|uniref:Uncharacterized protein n=1 Tax=Eumeta variegata TaxID=151549 RepID=A0A4C1UQ54_EUMVA|nr:hypothetical protein EVAR_85792_1 [Eumeta japonica]
MSYDILLWGDAADVHRIFVLQKRVLWAIYKLEPRVSLRTTRKKISAVYNHLQRQRSHQNVTALLKRNMLLPSKSVVSLRPEALRGRREQVLCAPDRNFTQKLCVQALCSQSVDHVLIIQTNNNNSNVLRRCCLDEISLLLSAATISSTKLSWRVLALSEKTTPRLSNVVSSCLGGGEGADSRTEKSGLFATMRLVWVRVKSGLTGLFILGAYAPDMTKPFEQREELWSDIRDILGNYRSLDNEYVVLDVIVTGYWFTDYEKMVYCRLSVYLEGYESLFEGIACRAALLHRAKKYTLLRMLKFLTIRHRLHRADGDMCFDPRHLSGISPDNIRKSERRSSKQNDSLHSGAIGVFCESTRGSKWMKVTWQSSVNRADGRLLHMLGAPSFDVVNY